MYVSRLVKEGYHRMTESANQGGLTIAGRIAVQFPAHCDSQGRVGHQAIDGTLLAQVETSGALLQRATEAERQCAAQTERADAAEAKAEALMVALAQAVDELTEAQNERNKAEGLAEAYCATYRSTRCLWHAVATQRDDLHRDKEVQAEIINALRHDLAVMTEARDVAVAVCDLARRDAADLADAVMQCGWLISALRALLLGLAGCPREESEDGMTVWYGVPSGLAARASGLAARLRQQVEREKGGRG
jgi:hypothetical protein